MSQIAMSTGDVFITSAKLQKSFFGMSESLGFIADFSGQTLETMTNLEQRLGLATGEAAEMTMLFKLQGNNTEEIASNTFDTLTNSIKLGNVAVTPKQVFEEIAKTTASIKVSLGANPEALGKAVIAAKQLGASLAQIDQIAASTLDFESSISSELEAELLTGKQLNLERARLLALNNDFAGVAEEITKQGIDFATPAKSLFKASNLALSKLSCLPVSNSASNSDDIDDSKSNVLAAIWSICAKDAPNCFAAITALPSASGLAPKDTFIDAVVFAISSNTCFGVTATLPSLIELVNVSNVFDAISSVLLP
jgi:hypothetical protein